MFLRRTYRSNERTVLKVICDYIGWQRSWILPVWNKSGLKYKWTIFMYICAAYIYIYIYIYIYYIWHVFFCICFECSIMRQNANEFLLNLLMGWILATVSPGFSWSKSSELAYSIVMLNFNSAADYVWEWINDFIPRLTGHVITYPCWD